MEKIGTETTKKITVQELVDGIVELIHKGTYLPGAPVREVELCRLFGVSRTPVREALRLLQNSGVVEYIPRCGVQIAEMSRETLSNITETRTVLEVLSTRQAAQRITQEEVEELYRINECFHAASDPKERSGLDNLFHTRIAEISGNPCVVQFLSNLLLRQAVVPATFEDRPQRSQFSYVEHNGILQALELRAPELAAKQADIHFHMSQASLQSKLEAYLQKRSE